MIFCSMQKQEGRVLRIGQTFQVTGLYFFFTAKVMSSLSALNNVQVDCDNPSLSWSFTKGGVVVHTVVLLTSKYQRATSVSEHEGKRQEYEVIMLLPGFFES